MRVHARNSFPRLFNTAPKRPNFWYNLAIFRIMKITRERLTAMIDHTFLNAAGETDAVERLCKKVKRYHFACAMVKPCEARTAAK